MNDTPQRRKHRNRLPALIAAMALTCGAPLILAEGQGADHAGANANQNAVEHGGNLGQGAAPLPEPATWAAMGALLIAAGALIAREKRRRA